MKSKKSMQCLSLGASALGKRIAELASKDPQKNLFWNWVEAIHFIVLDDADLSQTAYTATQSRLLNTGQTEVSR